MTDLANKKITKIDASTGDVIKVCDLKTMTPVDFGIAVDKMAFVYVVFGIPSEIYAFTPDLDNHKIVLSWDSGMFALNSHMMLSNEDDEGKNFIQRYKIVYKQ